MSDDDAPTSTVLVLTPEADDPAAQGVDEPHITLAYLNDGTTPTEDGVLDQLRTVLEQVAGATPPFQMKVAGGGYLGPDKARVLLLESPDLRDLRNALMVSSAVQEATTVEPYPFYIPHMTIGYEGTELPEQLPEQVSGAALGLWVQGQKEVFELGGDGETDVSELMVPVASSADLDLGIRVANQYPGSRWYVSKRARALGMEHRLPADWGAA